MTRANVDAILQDVVTPSVKHSMRDTVARLIDELVPTEVVRLTVSEWAETKRILPEGLSPVPGPFSFDLTPYLREIVDCLSVTSPIQRVVFMKGAQIGFTVGVLENWIGYIIDVAPGPAMFVSADKSVAETSVELRVDRMIESAGLKDRIFAQSGGAKARRTGDTKSKKEFPGGFLLAVGPNVGSKLRSVAIRYLLIDEEDAAPLEVAHEGDPITLAVRRTDAFESVRKILEGSTPLVKNTSRINAGYLSGDQRKFHVPCRHCGAEQPLEFERLKFDRDKNGRLVTGSVHYECRECGGHWTNDDKAWFLPRGRWVAHAESEDPTLRSYHLSSLYSPIGFRSWESIAREWLAVKDNPVRLRAFVNTVLGEPWEERNLAPRYELVMLRAGGYRAGTLPGDHSALFCTIGADVQSDRIEAEVVAWGRGKRNWSVSYHVFVGDTEDLNSNAWHGLRDLIERHHAELSVAIVLIDAGYRTPNCYAFCNQYQSGVWPVMGDARVGKERRIFRMADLEGFQTRRVDLWTDVLKSEFYAMARAMKPENGASPPGYCRWPDEYGEAYYQQLFAEHRVRETTASGTRRYVWRKTRERNEAHDCRVYALGALYVHAVDISERILGNEEGVEWDAFWDWAESTYAGGDAAPVSS